MRNLKDNDPLFGPEAMAVASELLDSGDAILSACVPTAGAGDSVDITGGTAAVGGSEVSVSSQNVSLTARGSSTRYDLVVIDGVGAASSVDGGSETAPDLGTGQVPVALVKVPPDGSGVAISVFDIRPLTINTMMESLLVSDTVDADRSGGSGTVKNLEDSGEFGTLKLPRHTSDPSADAGEFWYRSDTEEVRFQSETGVGIVPGFDPANVTNPILRYAQSNGTIRALSAVDVSTGTTPGFPEVRFSGPSGTVYALHDNADAGVDSQSFGVTTDSAENLGTDSADVYGTLDGLGGESSVDVYFQYRETGTSTFSDTSKTTVSATEEYSESLSGLSTTTEYEFRFAADGSTGTETGELKTFTTGETLPIVVTRSPSFVGTTTATMEGRLDDLGSDTSAEVYFEWREVGANQLTQTTKQSVSATGDFSESLSGLSDGTEYEYRAVAETVAGVETGTFTSFTAGEEIPTVQTDAPTNIGETEATFNGTLNQIGTGASADVWFEWWQPGIGGFTQTPKATKSATGSFSEDETGLTAGTDYEVRAVAENDAGKDTGSLQAFTTESGPPSPGVIDDHNDGSIAEYSVQHDGGGDTSQNTVSESGGSLTIGANGGTQTTVVSVSGLNKYPEAGNTFETNYSCQSVGFRVYFAAQGNSSPDPDGYRVQMRTSDSSFPIIAIMLIENGSTSILSSISNGPAPGSGLIEVDWGLNGNISVTVTDSNNDTYNVSATDTTWTEGGFGYVGTNPEDDPVETSSASLSEITA